MPCGVKQELAKQDTQWVVDAAGDRPIPPVSLGSQLVMDFHQATHLGDRRMALLLYYVPNLESPIMRTMFRQMYHLCSGKPQSGKKDPTRDPGLRKWVWGMNMGSWTLLKNELLFLAINTCLCLTTPQDGWRPTPPEQRQLQ